MKNSQVSAALFPKNEHGHYVVTLAGLAINGAEEVSRLEAAGFYVDGSAKVILLNMRGRVYDEKHLLEDGKVYRVALVPGSDAKQGLRPQRMQEYGEQFGYKTPRAGLMPRIRECVTDKQMEQMGFRYIAAFHGYIRGMILRSNRCVGGNRLDGYRIPGPLNALRGAFAFEIPE